jgi:predicted P-loop ATPase
VWDRVDRMQMLVDRLAIDTTRGLTEKHCVELLKDWHSKAWQKLYNPEFVQNRLIVLTGPQKIGKDFWIEENIAALGQFANPLHVEQNNKDTRLQLHASMVCTIAEFDRTSKWEQSTLKDLVTSSATNMRAPYDRSARYRRVRCSLVSSCNIDDVLIDPTGNRRYILFHLLMIDKSRRFSSEDRLQILAQGKQLASEKYEASLETELALEVLLKSETPQAFADSILEQFDMLAYNAFKMEGSYATEEFCKADKAEKDGYVAGLYNGCESQARIFQELRRNNGNLTEVRLRKLLGKRRRYVRIGELVKRAYFFRNPEASELH